NLTGPDFRFTTSRDLQIQAGMSFEQLPGTHTFLLTAWQLNNSGAAIYFPIPIEVGCRITAYAAVINKMTNATVTHQIRLYRTNTVGTQIQVGIGATTDANNPGFVTLQDNITHDVISSQYYVILNASVGNPTDDEYYFVIITYTRP
ncbi:MAG: hypothetical protein ACREJC_02510, partial [Tepidisphaeraceae bacterium]